MPVAADSKTSSSPPSPPGTAGANSQRDSPDDHLPAAYVVLPGGFGSYSRSVIYRYPPVAATPLNGGFDGSPVPLTAIDPGTGPVDAPDPINGYIETGRVPVTERYP